MKVLIIAKIIFATLQMPSDSLPTNAELFASLRSFHAETSNARTAEYNAKEKNAYLKYLPSLGIQYNLQGQPRPSIGYNFNSIYTHRNETERTKAKIKAVQLQAEIEFKNDSFAIVEKLKRLDILKKSLLWLEAQNRIDDKIFENDKAFYAANQMSENDYLTKTRQYLERRERYEKVIQDIELLEIEILRLAKT